MKYSTQAALLKKIQRIADLGVSDKCAGDGYPLFLTPRKPNSSLAYQRIVALVQVTNELVCIRQGSGLFDLNAVITS